jgi:hypothetical protein
MVSRKPSPPLQSTPLSRYETFLTFISLAEVSEPEQSLPKAQSEEAVAEEQVSQDSPDEEAPGECHVMRSYLKFADLVL